MHTNSKLHEFSPIWHIRARNFLTEFGNFSRLGSFSESKNKNKIKFNQLVEELAKVCECRRLILPVFYQVDPSDVRRQKGRFHEDFGKLEARFGEDKVLRWRKAMEKAGGIAGWVFNG